MTAITNEERSRLELLMGLTQMFAPSLSPEQFDALRKTLFEALGVNLPEAPADEPASLTLEV